MEEEQKEEVPEEPTEDKSLIDNANEVAARIEAANAKKEELLLREEKFAATKVLDGQADAGGVTPKPKEITDKEYAQKVMAGEVP